MTGVSAPASFPRPKGRRSENAAAVAHDVLETIGKGKKLNKGKIVKKNGYSDAVAKNPQQVTESLSYKEVIDPFVNKLITERDRIVEAMKGRKLSKERYQTLIDGLDKLTKNIQLLTGGDTERDGSLEKHVNSLNDLMKNIKAAKKK